MTRLLIAVLLLTPAFADANLRDRPRSFFGTSAATIYEIGSTQQANVLIEGNSAEALFDAMTGVTLEHEAVSGAEGSVMYYRDVKRGTSLTCMLDRAVYSCSLNLGDRTTGKIDSAPR